MKSHSIELPRYERFEDRFDSPRKTGWLRRLNKGQRLALKAFAAVVPALAVVVVSLWIIAQPGLVIYLQAGTLAFGFVFLALALESRLLVTALLHALSGLALFVLSRASIHFGAEFLLLSAVIMAAWLAWALFRRVDV